MKTVQDVVVTVERALRQDPRPCCFHCLGIASEQLCQQAEEYIRERLSTVYTVENGTCYRRDHHARVVHPREAARPLPKL
jgi:hypothetical protein